MAIKITAETLADLVDNFDAPENLTGIDAQAAKLADEYEEGFGRLVYPNNLEEIDHWVMFSPFEYSRENRYAAANQGDAGFRGNIALPVPADLSTGYGANYQQEELGIPGLATARAAEKANDIIKSFQRGSSVQEKAKSLSENIKHLWGEAGDNAAGALASLGLAVDDFAWSGVSIGTGIQRNPHLAVLFTGVGFRQHRFNYKFTPKSQDETVSLYNIIRMFKAGMHPSYVQGFQNHLFKYPDEWDITFHHPQFKIGPSVLLDFQINYHGEGVPSYFRDNTPTVYTISMTFQETSIVTREDVLMRQR